MSSLNVYDWMGERDPTLQIVPNYPFIQLHCTQIIYFSLNMKNVSFTTILIFLKVMDWLQDISLPKPAKITEWNRNILIITKLKNLSKLFSKQSEKGKLIIYCSYFKYILGMPSLRKTQSNLDFPNQGGGGVSGGSQSRFFTFI
jgi:hypothetical protein